MNEKRVACFFSCGYTEASGTMPLFLKKIRGDLHYEQCMPVNTRKRKGSPKKLRNEDSGRSGEALLDVVYAFAAKYADRFISGYYSYLLIEDDLDGRFEKEADGNMEEVYRIKNEYELGIKIRIKEIIGIEIPVLFIYASPEIESWFIADWNNGFGDLFDSSVYFAGCLPKGFFSHQLKKRVYDELLHDNDRNIELYAYSTGYYRKLSDDLIALIQKETIEENESRSLQNCYYYSKKSHGGYMLGKIEPYTLRSKCRDYFEKCFLDLVNA